MVARAANGAGMTIELDVAAARDWVRGHVGVEADGEEIHRQPWSVVRRYRTPDGPVYLKVVRDRSEVAVTRVLDEVSPEEPAYLIASDVDRGWMLLPHAGTRLRELVTTVDDLWRWEEALPRYARLQRRVVPRVPDLLAAGAPAQPLGTLADEVADLLDDRHDLMLGHPEGLTEAQRATMRDRLPDVRRLADELAGLGIPETIQHDDLNDGNVYVRDGRGRVWDWGDACVSHPFHSLTVLLRATAYRLGLEPGGHELQRLRDAYLEPFTDVLDRATLVDAAAIAYRTGTLARALAWRRYVHAAPPGEADEDLEAVPYGLLRFLDDGPIGAWR